MRMLIELQTRNIDIFKLDICTGNFKATIERPISKSWIEFRIFGFGLDINFNPKCTCPHDCTHKRIRIYLATIDIKRLLRRYIWKIR